MITQESTAPAQLRTSKAMTSENHDGGKPLMSEALAALLHDSRIQLSAAACAPTEWVFKSGSLQRAVAAEDTYHSNVWMPAYRAEKSGGPAFPKEIDAEYMRLQAQRFESENDLFAAPAPTLNEALWKIEYAREAMAELDGWPDAWWEHVLSDLRRLAGRKGEVAGV